MFIEIYALTALHVVVNAGWSQALQYSVLFTDQQADYIHVHVKRSVKSQVACTLVAKLLILIYLADFCSDEVGVNDLLSTLIAFPPHCCSPTPLDF